ncbi:non-ribosomal peptide synthase domain TIGR01720/amino acid adenylation domain-containing protein [Paraburkholderia steynii]|uniref:Non-ribosomal peptide synthase domain TIGR01720/amino acid adenylation domain-containing protein n=1 Tax=Paraburkholderia steynii TaxID=1245441 RepID=A0A7Z7B638_9BURK|nr:non-ribosomal peptide synthetase [Paraburkholderia steynii]SDH80191.1 non-ribosomal peptide synthase domain TIGR01720/amino acid adenylation domain-containing protein [Paraburkholderia steynii]
MTTFPTALHQRLCELARSTPNAPALAAFSPHTVRMSRGELDARASNVAAVLRARGVGAEVRVGVCIDRSCDLFVALLAVLKAGGVFVPLDPRHPAQRLDWMARDAGLRHGIVTRAADATMRARFEHCIEVDAIDSTQAVIFDDAQVHPRSAAYMIYTSGSTGTPKAVVVEHGALAAHCDAVIDAYPMTDADRVLHFASVNFDLAHEYWLAPLAAGASIAITAPGTVAPDDARALVEQERVTIAAFPPAYLREFAQAARRHGVPAALRVLAFGGEAMPGDVFADIRQTFNDVRLINGYGPTETVISPMLWPLDAQAAFSDTSCASLPIGRPIGLRTARVSTPGSADGASIGDGSTGELLLGGACLARGYHGRAAQTAERFIPDADGAPGSRVYRTGDLARLRADGAYDYMGRIDDQVQIRGVRVEPGEIAQCLRSHSGVRDAAMLVEQSATRVQLTACVVIESAADESALREHLLRHLPEAWQPHRFALLDALPYTLNGKLDRELLRARVASQTAVASYREPQGETARKLAAIWQAILGDEPVGLDDSFHARGGDSIAIMRLQAAIRAELRVNLRLDALFVDRSLEELAALVDASEVEDLTQPLPLKAPARSTMETDYTDYRASFAQQRFWVLAQTRDAGDAYHIAAHWNIRGSIDHALLKKALAQVIERHEAWRTTLHEDDDGIVMQRVHARTAVPVDQPDLRGIALESRKARASELADEHATRPFDLQRGPLLRASLVTFADDEHCLMLTAHHAISDGWSSRCAFAELAEAYAALSENRAAALPMLTAQYADFAQWQREWLDGAERERQLGYWRDTLKDAPAPLALPVDRTIPAERTLIGKRASRRLDQHVSAAVRDLASGAHASTFIVLLTALHAWLHRLTAATDVVIAAPVANRQRAEVANLLGLFINTVALRARVSPHAPFNALLAQVRDTTLGAYANQDIPFDQVIDAVKPPVRRGEEWLRVKFAQQFVFDEPVALPGAVATLTPGPDNAARFDFALDFTDDARGIELVAAWATDCIDDATAQAWLDSFVALLTDSVANPALAVSSLACAEPRSNLLQGRAQTSEFADVVAAFTHHANATPKQIAVTDAQRQLTFEELDRASSRAARALIEHGAVAERAVALCIDRSVDFVVALLAVLKSGAMAVPLDPAAPRERIEASIAACDACGVFVAANALQIETKAPVLSLDKLIDTHSEAACAPIAPEQAAYLIYTSGSTGTPKGVVVSHRALADYVQGMLDELKFVPGASMAMVSTVAADLGHTTLFGALCSGRTLHLLPKEAAFDPDRFAATMRERGVGVLKIVPSHLHALLEAQQPADVLPAHALVLGGESLPWTLVERITSLRPACRVINHYGPTEATVGALTFDATANMSGASASAGVPTGRPLPNSRAFVLDANGAPVPVGGIGELYLGGPGVARGYLGRASATAERFVPDASGARMYRTGDRVRLRADGAIDYLGRLDDQVKIRGYRVEPGEVSATLRALGGVRQAETLAIQEDGRARLASFVVVQGESDEASLRTQLAARLPDYMVPATLTLCDAFPVTPNGKIDRAKLRELAQQPVVQSASEAPLEGIERILADVWKEVLRAERVGRDDNFFELGGDSILALQVIARSRKRGVRFTPKQLFDKPTVQQLAQVAQAVAVAEPKAETRAVSKPDASHVTLTPAQRRFFELTIPARHHWNQAIELHATEHFDLDAFAQAFDAALAHHDAFRLRFTQDASSSWSGRYADKPFDTLPLVAIEARDAHDALAQFDELQRSFDLARGPLAGALVAVLPDGTPRVWIAVHHLIVDGVSWRVLLEDLDAAYVAARERRAIRLAAQGAHASGWAQRLANNAAALFSKELPYWTSMQHANAAVPFDNPQGTATNADACTVEWTIDATLTQTLLTDANAAWRTQTIDLLVAALAHTLGASVEANSLLIELEGHGREALFEDFDASRSIGWLTSHYPVALPIGASSTDTLTAVKDALRAVPNKGVGFGVLRYLADYATRTTLAALPRPRVTFNYLGQFGETSTERALNARFGGAGCERDPAGPMSNALAIHAHIDGARKLKVHWVYSAAMFEAGTVEKLARTFESTLRDIAARCIERVSKRGASATPADFPLAQRAGLSQPMLERLDLDLRTVDDIYPLSPMQQGILFHSLYAPDRTTYVNQLVATLKSPDITRVTDAFNRVVPQHDILRTSFWHDADVPLQIVHRQAKLPVAVLDWRGRDAQDANFEQWLTEDRAQGFDLSQAPLMRVTLVRLTDDEWRLVWTRHHLLLDGWSTARMFADVLRDYMSERRALSFGQGARLRYRDFIAWLDARDHDADKAFWIERLARFDEPTLVAPNVSPESAAAAPHDVWRAQFDAATTAKLTALARSLRLTVNTLVQGAWALALQRMTHHATVAFGATVAGRPDSLPDVESVFGLFINTLPVIATPAPQRRIADWLADLQRDNAANAEHAHTPLFDIQRWAGQGGGAMFDTLVVFENYPVDPAWSATDERALRLSDIHSVESTDLAVTLVVQAGDTLTIDYGYDTARIDEARVQTLHRAFNASIEAFIADPHALLGSVSIATQDDCTQLARFNDTAHTWRDEQQLALHRQFERHAAATPNAIALDFIDATANRTRVTYAELDDHANRVAAALLNAGVKADSVVALCVERSIDMVVALFGVLKAGAAYLPVDPDYPADRIAYLLDDAQPAVVLTQRALHARVVASIRSGSAHVLCVEGLDAKAALETPIAVEPDQLAYLIYTSGSTGKPKGAGNTHRALANRIAWMQDAYRLTPQDVVLHKTPFGFDVSVWEFVWPLSVGATLAIAAPGDHRDPARLASAIATFGVTTLHFVPSMLGAFLGHLKDFDAAAQCTSIARIVASGEALSPELVARARVLLPQAQLHNLYGPTEAAIDVSHWTCTEADAQAVAVPIGKPIANIQLHALDASLHPLPAGAIGELYLGGVGLARGYLGRAALTAERFIPDPFTPGARLYRTGDLVCRRADGVFDYLGRADQQVKLRGLRIEPGEIEALLRAAPGVHDAVVIVRDEQLIGYVARRAEESFDQAALFATLNAQLPAYMVPAHVIELDALPVTPNGKCDRNALPAPSLQTTEVAEPQTDTERELAAIWTRVLRIDASHAIGRDADFFALGGHSLLATQANAQINLHWSLALPLRTLFDARTLSRCAAAIDAALEARGAHSLDDAARAIDALLGELEAQ